MLLLSPTAGATPRSCLTARRGPGAAVDAVLLGGVHGLGAGRRGPLGRKIRGKPPQPRRRLPPPNRVYGPFCVSGPATRLCVRVLFVAWEGRAAAPAVNSAPRADRLLLPFLLQGKRPIEHGHGCGLPPLYGPSPPRRPPLLQPRSLRLQALGRDGAADGRTAPAGLRHPPPPNRTCDFHRIRLSIRWVRLVCREHRLFRHPRRVHTSRLRRSSLRSTPI